MEKSSPPQLISLPVELWRSEIFPLMSVKDFPNLRMVCHLFFVLITYPFWEQWIPLPILPTYKLPDLCTIYQTSPSDLVVLQGVSGLPCVLYGVYVPKDSSITSDLIDFMRPLFPFIRAIDLVRIGNIPKFGSPGSIPIYPSLQLLRLPIEEGYFKCMFWSDSLCRFSFPRSLVMEFVIIGDYDQLIKVSALYYASKKGLTEMVRALLSQNDYELKNINQITNTTESTALSAACLWERVEIVSILLEHGADPNVVSTNYWRESPLTIAAKYWRHDIVSLLLQYGADKTHKNSSHKNVLDYASEGGFSHLLVGSNM